MGNEQGRIAAGCAARCVRSRSSSGGDGGSGSGSGTSSDRSSGRRSGRSLLVVVGWGMSEAAGGGAIRAWIKAIGANGYLWVLEKFHSAVTAEDGFQILEKKNSFDFSASRNCRSDHRRPVFHFC